MTDSSMIPYFLLGGTVNATNISSYRIFTIPLHYIQPGHSFAPESWAIACVSFDLVVAAYIVIVYGLGLVGERRQALRSNAP
jgi:hypothetical protein